LENRAMAFQPFFSSQSLKKYREGGFYFVFSIDSMFK
jgi:hypothetical protein